MSNQLLEKQVQLAPLPYDFNALEPVISAEIMTLHYTKHHQTYVNNLNKALEEYATAQEREDLSKMIALQGALRFNGGGHLNHTFFWQILTPSAKAMPAPEGPLAEALAHQFGSFQTFVDEFNSKTAAIQGSGWGWLGYNKEKKSLTLATTSNQDPPSTLGLTPLFGVDVWEHAYYLQYKNARADYLKAIWKIINWPYISTLYSQAISPK